MSVTVTLSTDELEQVKQLTQTRTSTELQT
jgi:hypothetical protein